MIRWKLLILFSLCAIGLQPLFSQDQTLKSWYDSPIDPQGQVNSIVVAGNTAYLGGTFKLCGFSTGFGAALDTGTAEADHYFPKFFNTPGGRVMCAVPDSQGGWYIGGSFTTVNGQSKKYLAHINADKSVDPWNPSPNAFVNTIYFGGGRVYAGGYFDSVGGQPRGHGAAFDASGNLLPWNPHTDNSVTAIQPVGNIVYVGGSFFSIGGRSQMLLGAVDNTAGNLITGWYPLNGGPSGSFGISKFIYSNHQIFMCGSFSQINSISRNSLAKMDESGNLSAWNPGKTMYATFISDMYLYGGKLYVSGAFDSVNGNARNNLAALDTATGLPTSWKPATSAGQSNAIYALSAAGSKLYIGGTFTSIGNKSISYLGAVDTGTGAAYAWNPKLNERVFNLAAYGSTVYAAGYFAASGVTTRNRLAAIDLGTGGLKAWDPNADGTVFALAFSAGKIFAGGGFNYIGSSNRPSLVTLDTINGAPLSGVGMSGAGITILSLAVTGGRLYAGSNNGIYAYNIPTGKALGFHPMFDYPVIYTVATNGSTVYAGGIFSTVNGQSRSNAAAFDTSTDQLTGWSPSLSSTCYAIAVAGSRVYLGGSFSTVNGQSSPSVAAVDAATGSSLNGFTSSFSTIGYKVSSLAFSGNQLYVGGQFSPVGTITGTDYLATLNATTGAVSAFRSGILVSGEVTSIVLLPQSVLLGGYFISTLKAPQTNFSVLNDTSIHSVGAPSLQMIPRIVAFGNVAVGLFKDTLLTIGNGGTDTLKISGIAASSNAFSSRLFTATVPPQQFITDTIRFAPAAGNGYSSLLLVSSNSSSVADTVFLSGTGIIAKFVQLQFSKAPISFGAVKIGSWRDSIISVTNIGTDTAAVTVTVSDTALIASPTYFNLAPAASTPLTLRFKPGVAGDFAGRFFIANARTTPSLDTIRVTGLGSAATSVMDPAILPTTTALLQNYPNPFNPGTVFSYQLATANPVSLKVFNALGEEVARIFDGYQQPGTYTFSFDASQLSSGVYFYTLRTGTFAQTKRMILMK